MLTKLVAGACALGLAAALGPGAAEDLAPRHRSIAARLSAPVHLGEDSGHASFASTVAGTRWRFMMAWSSHASRLQLGLALVSEGAD